MIENNVKVSWQLVSQFVSWEFCRYMCQQSEKENAKVETDVLTFLRNMIVERTEKANSDITKHEIVAKFVMETRTIQKASRMPCITTLSETLLKICPELKVPTNTLLPRLEGLLRVLDWNEDTDNRELVLFSIVEAVNDFTKEACKVLPMPDLPQIVEPLLHSGSEGQQQRVKFKSVANIELYEKSVACLREEKITPTEAKIIAELLYEDKELETLFLNFSQTETDIDSQQQSFSLPSSQQPLPVPLQESLQLCSQTKLNSFVPQTELYPLVKSLTLDEFAELPRAETIPESPIKTRFQKSPEKTMLPEPCIKTKFQMSPERITLPEPPTKTRLQMLTERMTLPEPPTKTRLQMLTERMTLPKPPIKTRFQRSSERTTLPEPPIKTRFQNPPERTMLHDDEFKSLNKSRHSLTEPARMELYDYSEPKFEDIRPRTPKRISKGLSSSNVSPVLLASRKKNRKRYLEFIQYVDSSSDEADYRPVIPNANGSENPENDPQFPLLTTQLTYDSDTSDCDKHGEVRFLTPTIYKKDHVPVNPPAKAVLVSEQESLGSSIDFSMIDNRRKDPDFKIRLKPSANACPLSRSPKKRKKAPKEPPKCSKRKPIQTNKSSKAPQQKTLQGFGFSPATTVSSEKSSITRNTARKRPFKLFNNDMMPENLDESALFQKKELRKKPIPKKKCEDLGNRRRCHECKKTFKTPLQLKKHVFIVHTIEDLSD